MGHGCWLIKKRLGLLRSAIICSAPHGYCNGYLLVEVTVAVVVGGWMVVMVLKPVAAENQAHVVDRSSALIREPYGNWWLFALRGHSLRVRGTPPRCSCSYTCVYLCVLVCTCVCVVFYVRTFVIACILFLGRRVRVRVRAYVCTLLVFSENLSFSSFSSFCLQSLALNAM